MTSRRPYWCSKAKKQWPYWCSKPVLWELNSIFMQQSSFVCVKQYGGLSHECMKRRSDGASYWEPKKIHGPEILHPKQYLASKFSTQKNTRLSTSILISSIKQTLRPKKIHDRSLDPKKYRGSKFTLEALYNSCA